MATIFLTDNLSRHLDSRHFDAPGGTLQEVFEAAFCVRPALRPYIVDDQGCLRKHVTVFVDGVRLLDRDGLSDGVGSSSEIYIMQALSGG